MIERLELFIVLAREKHFGRAAEACGITQPTLSSAIKQLENALGVMLVRRGARFGGLTPEGELVLEWARRIVGDARAMQEELEASRHGLSGRLRIAVIPTALTAVSDLTTPFLLRHPHVGFSVFSCTSIEILSLVGSFEADIGITYLDNEPLGPVVSVPLYTERYHLVTATSAPIAEKGEVTWAEVGALPLCLLTADMQNRRIIDRHLSQAGAPARPALDSNSMIVLLSHVRSGKWASIMPGNLVGGLDFSPGILSIPIVEPTVSHTVGIIAANREPQTPQVAAFLAEARQMANQVR
ncbi:LysR family transcriptional regulator [Pelagibacterium limicola]|uniref:LysR family transcriptional regulator n=1 Tax=Pelagibacterium limicola TaxID=2791022 RepID=UPI0018AFCF9C|nr:LysR family transcriptional regulator [Pelagibacterium limicola]